MKLTKAAIESLSYAYSDNRRDVRWDDSLPGFGVRLYPSGRKAFVLSYRTAGRKRLMTLGNAGVLTPDQARKAARRHIVSIDGNTDPLADKQKVTQGETVADLCSAYLERHAKQRKKTWRDDERRINKRVLPAWRRRQAKSITRADVAALHTTIGRTAPYEANRVLRLLSRMFGLARRWGFVPDGHTNPAADIDLYSEHKRDRWVTPTELPRLAEAIDAEPNIYARAALWLYLLTGLRKTELLQSRWDAIDFDRRELRLPETKAGRIHYVPLTEPALAILRELPRVEGNPHVLPGRNEGWHLVNISKPWNRVRRVAGVGDVRLHDLRRTVGSWLAQAGNSLHLIGRVLNHSNTSTTAVYARFAQDQVREALEQHADRLMGAARRKDTVDITTRK